MRGVPHAALPYPFPQCPTSLLLIVGLPNFHVATQVRKGHAEK